MVAHEIRKLKRLNILKEIMKKKYDKEKVIADCIINWGSTRRTILEYMKTIEVMNG